MAFKVKTKVSKKTDNKITLDAKHNDKLSEIYKIQNSLDTKKKDLEILKNRYNKIKNDKSINIDEKLNLKDQIIDIESFIKNNKHNNDINYLLDTGHIMYEYYDNIDHKSYTLEPKIKSKNKKKCIRLF